MHQPVFLELREVAVKPDFTYRDRAGKTWAWNSYWRIKITCCKQTPRNKLEVADDGTIERQLFDINGSRLLYVSIIFNQ